MIRSFKHLLVCSLALLTFSGTCHAEECPSLLGNLKDDFLYVASSPATMDRDHALLTLGIVTAGAALYTQDDKIRDYFQDRHSSSVDDMSSIVANLGDGLYDLAFLAAFGLSGYAADNKKMQDTALLSLESFIVANTIGTATKMGAGRSRPYTDEGATSFSPFSTDTAHTSMPSGHTVSIFSIASVFAGQYDNMVVDTTAYGLAALVGLQRIYDDKHWASDVLAGAVIGIVSGKSVLYLHERKDQSSVTFVPIITPDQQGGGIAAVMHF